jgi:hypothetical protein
MANQMAESARVLASTICHFHSGRTFSSGLVSTYPAAPADRGIGLQAGSYVRGHITGRSSLSSGRCAHCAPQPLDRPSGDRSPSSRRREAAWAGRRQQPCPVVWLAGVKPYCSVRRDTASRRTAASFVLEAERALVVEGGGHARPADRRRLGRNGQAGGAERVLGLFP